MKFVVLFEDNPAAGTDVRRQHMAAHHDTIAVRVPVQAK